MTTAVRLQWATPDIDAQIAFQARVSNPANQNSTEIARLLNYCMREGHVSPFDMANVCLEIATTRDIGRQILRHHSIRFQEASQRYQDVGVFGEVPVREARMQDTKNRQNSLPCTDQETADWWYAYQTTLVDSARTIYTEALRRGIAKEQARVVLPEGLTPSVLYANGTMRSWIFYLKQRLHPSTQREHRDVATGALDILRTVAPITMDAFFPETEE